MVEILLYSPKYYFRILNYWVDMVMVGLCEDIKFIGCEDGGFISREIRDRIIVLEEQFIVELVYCGEAIIFSPVVVILFSIGEGKDLVCVSIELGVTTLVDDI